MSAKFWLNWVSGARRSKLNKSSKIDKELLEPQSESNGAEIGVDTEAPWIGFPLSATESIKAVVIHFYSKCLTLFSSLWRNTTHFLSTFSQLRSSAGWGMLDVRKWSPMFHLERLGSVIVQWLDKRSKAFEPTYLYTVEKGYFLLSEGAKSRHNVRIVNITISAQHSCFGNRWQQLLINSFIGYDTILMNSLLSFPGQGYLYNFQTKEFYDLSYAHEPTKGSPRYEDYLVTKCGVLIMSLFVFFTTTMSVSFTLRETQSRMLKFTVQLEHHARYRLPTFQLIFVHVIESLVFVPIMIGILFFLFEFYKDQLLAFMVLVLVWLCELFTLISVRTPVSIQFFPRFFLLYFLVFHIYFFSYAYGFSYLAFATTASFMYHLILYFWNRFEVPALERFMRSRSQLQQPQQPGIHITSSILTSALNIARVNPVPADNELRPGSGPGPRHGLDQARLGNAEGVEITGAQELPATHNPDTVGSPLQFPPSDSQQTDIPPNSTALNPLGSMLLGILGDSRDNRYMRDATQVYAESPQQENRPVTQNSWWRRT
ncbi:S3 self-incompatibility locus-linked pollen protein isoform X2 [Tasmannia lanceolata]